MYGQTKSKAYQNFFSTWNTTIVWWSDRYSVSTFKGEGIKRKQKEHFHGNPSSQIHAQDLKQLFWIIKNKETWKLKQTKEILKTNSIWIILIASQIHSNWISVLKFACNLQAKTFYIFLLMEKIPSIMYIKAFHFPEHNIASQIGSSKHFLDRKSIKKKIFLSQNIDWDFLCLLYKTELIKPVFWDNIISIKAYLINLATMTHVWVTKMLEINVNSKQ